MTRTTNQVKNRILNCHEIEELIREDSRHRMMPLISFLRKPVSNEEDGNMN
jgi:hypothetical protein